MLVTRAVPRPLLVLVAGLCALAPLTAAAATAPASPHARGSGVIPAVNAVDPHAGTAAGGTPFTVYGSGFTNATAVSVGGSPLPTYTYTVLDDTQISISHSPPHSVGSVNITVATPSGTSALSAADRFNFVAPVTPVVQVVDPRSGSAAGGTQVQLHGTGFSAATAVTFGTAAAPSFYVIDDSTITVPATPANPVSGVNVTVTTPAGTSAVGARGAKFGYVAASAPRVDAVTPASGDPAGFNFVYLYGASFTGATAVTFGGVAANSFQVYTDTAISVQPPPGGAGKVVPVVVTTPAGKNAPSLAARYTYRAAGAGATAVFAVDPGAGAATGGTYVTVHGRGFTGATAVRFGTVHATFSAGDDGTVYATSPPGTAGTTVDVTVVTPTATSTTSKADLFTFLAPGGARVDGIAAAGGPAGGGTIVDIYGAGFTNAQSVYFAGTRATAMYRDAASPDTHLQAVAPAGAAGATVDVTVRIPGGATPVAAQDQFTYSTTTVASVTGLDPSSGFTQGGDAVTVYGHGFEGATTVTLGGTQVEGFNIISDSQLIAFTPPRASHGSADVVVANAAGSSATSAGDIFTYAASPSAPPVVTLVSPSSADGSVYPAQYFYITGSGFTGANGVRLDGVTQPAAFTVVSDTLIQAAAPNGTGGPYPVRVTNPAGDSTQQPGAAVSLGPGPTTPVVAGLDNQQGAASGGGTLAIYGANLANVSAVTFGGVASPSFGGSIDNNSVYASIPAGTAGTTVDVVVTANGAATPTGPQARYTYTTDPIPTVLGVGSTQAYAAGDNQKFVLVYGRGFLSATTLHLGSTTLTRGFGQSTFEVFDDFTISAPLPPGPLGVNDLTVSSSTGTSSVSPADRLTYVANAASTVRALSPAQGPQAGGDLVLLTGSGFLCGTAPPTVRFGAASSQQFGSPYSDTLMLVSSAAVSSAGVVDVTVTTACGSSAVVPGDRFTYSPATLPSVSAVAPASGTSVGGDTVWVTGSGFSGTTAVTVGGVNAQFQPFSDHLLSLTTPPGTIGSSPDIVVTALGGTSAATPADRFTYTTPPPPTVTAVSPASGRADGALPTTVFVTGTNFLGTQAVSAGGQPVQFVVQSATLIALYSMTSGPAGTAVDVTVTTPGGTSATAAGDRYTYVTTPAPTVAVVTPASGSAAGGAPVWISGTGLLDTTAVRFGTVTVAAGNWTVLSDTLIQVSAPAAPVATVDVTVATPGGTSATSANDRFAYTAARKPVVTVFGPTQGPAAGGTTVYIEGSAFSSATSVMFGATATSNLAVLSDSLVSVQAPPGTSGKSVAITVTGPGGTSVATTAMFAYK